jgi:8-oxo-dGTP diphosphatase
LCFVPACLTFRFIQGTESKVQSSKYKAQSSNQRVNLYEMLKGFLSAVFRGTPRFLRRLFSRAVNARFSATAGAIVVDESGRILLLKHVFRAGSGWGIPGGFIESGEQPEAAVRRELREEVGLELESAQIVFVRTLQSIQQIEFLFYCRPRGTAEPSSIEVKEVGWFLPDALPPSLGEDQRMLIDRALSYRANAPS